MNSERRFALARLVGSAFLAAGLTLALFTNRIRLLAALGDVAIFWLPAVAVLALTLRLFRNASWSKGLARNRTGISIALFIASSVVAWSLTSRGGRLARHIVEFLVVWLPMLLLLNWRYWLRRWRDLIATAVSSMVVILSLWLAGPEIMRRWILPQYALDLDHRPRPGTDQTNEDGVYTSRPASAFGPDGFNVICIGDSFTANPHLPPEERFPDRLEALLRQRCSHRVIRVANFGWVSSSPVLQARRLREIGSRYHPALVVQAIDMTDFHDDLRATARIRRLNLDGRGRDVTIFHAVGAAVSRLLGTDDYGEWLRAYFVLAPPAQRTEIPRRRFFPLFQPLSATEPYLDTTWRAILETERIARSQGARFALVVFPRYQQYNSQEAPRDLEKRAFPPSDEFILEPFRFFETRRGSVSFPIHSLREDFLRAYVFPTCREDDPHWNAEGNRVAAEALARFLEADGLLPCGRETT
ncbi:MAG: hypothetical protein JXO72_12975 [Vicinamibacteria bacterium]|nr:hypothetical protein [Vicinamibacteria bacterium]